MSLTKNVNDMSNIKDLFVSYEIARKLKEKGFNDGCLACYNKDEEVFMSNLGVGCTTVSNLALGNIQSPHLAAPLYQQVIDFLYHPHNLVVGYDYKTDLWTVSRERYLLYECATQEQAIEKAIKLI